MDAAKPVGEEERGGVWEEALVEEMVYLIGHLAHAEQHLMEIESKQGIPLVTPMIDRIRHARKLVGEVLFETLSIESKESGGEFRSKSESLWCTLKHLSMALIHCDESAEKIMRRLMKLAEGSADEEAVKNLIDCLRKLYTVRETISEKIKELLFETPKKIAFVESVRCREDLCLEAEAKA